jgi:hypothetical protein
MRGRRVAQALYYLLAASVAVAATVQITGQVFFSREASGSVPFRTCQEGVRGLYEAVERGRAAAERSLPDDSEEAPLLRFRAEVAKVWRARDAVGELCSATAEHSRLLEALDRLRYSEEHGVRHQAEELTALRGRVRKLMEESFGRR